MGLHIPLSPFSTLSAGVQLGICVQCTRKGLCRAELLLERRRAVLLVFARGTGALEITVQQDCLKAKIQLCSLQHSKIS